MDILTLFLLYYLSQKPELLDSIKPIAQMLKNSEETLKFLEDLKAFTSVFDGATAHSAPQGENPKQEKTETDKESENENRQSPFQGIADELLQKYLDEYLKNG